MASRGGQGHVPAVGGWHLRGLSRALDPLQRGMAAHRSILAWRISWTEETGRLQPIGLQKSWARLKELEHTTHRALLLGPHG